MEGELAKTIEAISGVETAVVHLAMPEKQVFTDEQDPTTASVLVKTRIGVTLSNEQVQAIVHLVASSIDGLNPDDVTVSDATGKLLTVQDDSAAGAASTNQQQVKAFQSQMQTQIQSVLDRVVGAGNATSNVTAVLDFDSTKTNTRNYLYDAKVPPLSQTKQLEKYTGPGDQLNSAVGGVVGPDGQMDPAASASNGPSTYENGTTTQDNAVGQIDEAREAAPGSVESLHIGVVLDSNKLGQIQPADIRNVIAAATGIDTTRGDTIDVSSMPFDRSTETDAAKELAKAEAKKAAAARLTWIRNGAIAAIIFMVLLLAWVRARRKAKAREEATAYVVEQLRADAEARAGELEASRLNELEATPRAPLELNPADEIRAELNDLVERQPEDVAALLRGWLVDHKS
jgi:flagellar M-ring protein FliF